MLAKVSLTLGCTRIQLAGFHSPLYLRAHTSDVPVFEQVFILDEYAFPYPDPDPGLIIDVGANIGLASIYFAQRYPAARILAIEPEPSNFEILVRNTSEYPTITPVHAALWDTNTRLKIANVDADKWAFQVTESRIASADEVDAVTVAELMLMAKSDVVDILKLDIEGAEYELFRSNYEDWLGKVRVIIIELHENMRTGSSEPFLDAVSVYPFEKHRLRENEVYIRSV